MKKVLIIIGVVVMGLFVLGGIYRFVYEKIQNPGESTSDSGLFNSKKSGSEPVALDSVKEATHISKVAGTPDAYWLRGLPIIWNDIEGRKGKFNWKKLDEMVIEGDKKLGGEAYHLATVWPYTNWDQKTCHSGAKYEATGHLRCDGDNLLLGAPCDLGAYAVFLGKVVERYDGDGVDDAPGLKFPIKHWEIMNEPSMQGGQLGGAGEDLKFFVGTSEEYFQILKTSHGAIKQSDPDAKVVQGGMAGMHKQFVDFWTPVFEAGGADYFDIANIHAISVEENNEDLHVTRFKKFIKKYGAGDKPIWVTEAQVGSLLGEPNDRKNFDQLLAKSTVFALVQGADKIFMIENWLFRSDQGPEMMKKDKKDDGKDYQKDLDKEDRLKTKDFEAATKNNPSHQVYLNLVDKLNHFDQVVIIQNDFVQNSSDYQGATSRVGQYKFINGNEVVYVLWGNAPLPREITGTVKVADIYGNSQKMEAGKIQLTDSPIFVEEL